MHWEAWVEKGESHLNTIHGQGIVYCPPLSSWLACVRISNLKSSSSSTKNGDYSWSVSSDSWRIYSKFHLEGFTFQHLQTTKSIRCIFTIVALVRFFACVIFQMSPQSGGMGCLEVWTIGQGHELSLFVNWIYLLWYFEKVTSQIMIASIASHTIHILTWWDILGAKGEDAFSFVLVAPWLEYSFVFIMIHQFWF